MQRWHLTLGLTATAAIGLFLAPRLFGARPVAPPEEFAPPRPATPPVEPGLPLGHLQVTAGLDRAAVLGGVDSERFLTVTVSAPASLASGPRRPVDLAVVLDGSGSMAARGKMEEARRAAKVLIRQLAPHDTFSLVTFDDAATTIIPARRVDDPATLANVIDRIDEGGGTNLYAGMEQGADQLRRSRVDGAVERMIVLSDGNANIGVTDPGALSRFAADLAADGITVSTVGLGLDYNEDLLAHLSDVGGGSYHFVAPDTSLSEVFREELVSTAAVVGQGTVVRVAMPEGVEPIEVLGWDATRAERGWDVFVGDVYAGDAKQIVMRVKVRPAAPGPLPVAAVDARYRDLSLGEAAHTPAAAQAEVVSSAAAVDASVDRDAAAAANRALGSWFLERSTRAYEAGDGAEAQSLARQGTEVLRSAARSLGVPELSVAADEIEAAARPMAAAPASSEEGRIQTKKNKELLRDLAR